MRSQDLSLTHPFGEESCSEGGENFKSSASRLSYKVDIGMEKVVV